MVYCYRVIIRFLSVITREKMSPTFRGGEFIICYRLGAYISRLVGTLMGRFCLRQNLNNCVIVPLGGKYMRGKILDLLRQAGDNYVSGEEMAEMLGTKVML